MMAETGFGIGLTTVDQGLVAVPRRLTRASWMSMRCPQSKLGRGTCGHLPVAPYLVVNFRFADPVGSENERVKITALRVKYRIACDLKGSAVPVGAVRGGFVCAL
jgi:hypothetical protein